MGTPTTPEPALLVASLLGRTPALVNAAADAFARQFGPLAWASATLPFSWTDYYGDELGPAPARRFVAAAPLLQDRARLPDVKRACGRMEIALSRAGQGRPVNIDPGYLTASQLVLASTKASPHRIYLGEGIHGELALLRGPDGYAPLPWTYPDYADLGMVGLMEALRRRLLSQRRMA